MNTPFLSIVIPVFNQWELTRQCLESIRETTPGQNFEVIVADNGSSDDTVTQCTPLGESLFPSRFTHLRLDQNYGFGPACNMGADRAEGKILFFLNNDTILTDNWLDPLTKALGSDLTLGAVGPLLLFPGSGRVQHLGVTFVPGAQAHHLYSNFPADHPLVHKKRDMKGLTGAALMLSADLFHECGGFYDRYINGWEDVDLCCEIRRRGKRLSCITDSVIYHLTSQTIGRFAMEGANYELLIKRQADFIRPDMHTCHLEDGYDVSLTPCQRMYATLQEDRQEYFQTLLKKGISPQECHDHLQAEPLWFEGYDLLADVLEKHGKFEEALSYRHLLSLFLPTREVLARELKTAVKAGNGDVVKLTRSRLEEVEERLKSMDTLTRKARAIVQRAGQWGDQVLVDIYEQWLTARGTSR